MAVLRKAPNASDVHAALHCEDIVEPYVLTPIIVTFCDRTLTQIDIQSYLEAGLKMVSFKMTHVVKGDKLSLLTSLDNAIAIYCEKYNMPSWPVAVIVDLPNACIRTGYLKEELHETSVFLKKDSIVEISSDMKYWNRCDTKRIFIDDPYTLKTVKKKTEISINFGETKLICIETINSSTIKCKVTGEGHLRSCQFFCFRGIKYMRPSISLQDKNLITFVKDYELDIIIVNFIRNANTIHRIRKLFHGKTTPLIIGGIGEQEGLNNVVSIIQASDGILLAREFLGETLINDYKIILIQAYVCAKCKELRKPFYISGNILEQTMDCGSLLYAELNDIKNIVSQGAGIVLRLYKSSINIFKKLNVLNNLCSTIDKLPSDYWAADVMWPPPVNAAEASVLACQLLAHQTGSSVIIVLTTTGKTAMQLSALAPHALIVAVTTKLAVARRLQLYRAVLPLIFEKKNASECTIKLDIEARIGYAIEFCKKNDILKGNKPYIVLRKSAPRSAYCDHISAWRLESEEKSYASQAGKGWCSL